ncbi:MAG: 8-amino-7-oxononanoate synthase [Clostridia bacterium]|jgi:8-amino-7-oxononanoate synthase|nr:8-amino-7-oxononanoate synthase [Clostridia bacterium]
MTDFYQELSAELNKLKNNFSYRQTTTILPPVASWITIAGHRYLNLAGNNYLGLANHSLIKEKALAALTDYGTGAIASRLIVGTLPLHDRVEQELARFQGTESALLFNTGYMANLGVIQALVGRDDFVFSDQLNHASIIDGIALSKSNLQIYRHQDLDHLASLLKNKDSFPGRKLIITDSIFSMDGDRAPLTELVRLKQKYGAVLMVDEAHSGGVFGPKGRGLAAEENIHHEVDIHLGTLSKAFGCFGGYVTGKKVLIDYLRNKSRAFIYTTALPPAVLGSILGAIQVVESGEGDKLRQNLHANASWLKAELLKLGYSTFNSSSQIIPVLIPGNEQVLKFSEGLKQRGIFALPIRYPTVPAGEERIRLSLMATHQKPDLEYALRQFSQLRNSDGDSKIILG